MYKIAFLAGALLCGTSLLAQQESLVIGPGDLLKVQVYDTPELDQHPRVDDAGNIPLLFVGNIAVAGKTPGQAASAIASAMVAAQLMLHPQVSVTIEQYATQNVSVLGEVNKPGNYAIATPRPVLDVLSMAGGLNALADRHVIVRHHKVPGSREIYFAKNDAGADAERDVYVYPGDTVLVAKTHFVYVLGDVARPGGYPMSTSDSPMTMLETLSEAGSPNKTAIVTGAKLIRKTPSGTQEIGFNIAAIENGKQPDFAVEADDVIFVPFSYMKNFVITGTSVAASVASAALYVR
ncbi:MAG TPA: polysaccharide biosynthesis/export family protein [Acidobacteriaceae bacterium]|nr:polysaccharide biosynthesis/export family protein [Acidobacteriaceae bacterium]